jgi:hypothetical protein
MVSLCGAGETPPIPPARPGRGGHGPPTRSRRDREIFQRFRPRFGMGAIGCTGGVVVSGAAGCDQPQRVARHRNNGGSPGASYLACVTRHTRL